MALYDVLCPTHGVREIYRKMNGDKPLACPVDNCPDEVARYFSADSLPSCRIDAAGEDISMDQRVRDGSAKFNLGLPGVSSSIGRDATGKAKVAYRPISNAEVGSNHNAREIAKRNNLTPVESGRYRTTPR